MSGYAWLGRMRSAVSCVADVDHSDPIGSRAKMQAMPARTRPLTDATTAHTAPRAARRLGGLLGAVTRRFGGPVKELVDRRAQRTTQQVLSEQLAGAVRAEVERLTAPTAETAQREAVRRDREFSQSLMLASGLPSLDRTVTPGKIAQLRSQVQALAPSPLVDLLIRQAYRQIIDHETRGVGRIAGSTYNILGKLTVPALLNPPSGPVLEIGTLYGLFIPALMRQLRRNGEFRRLTVIDPFFGVQLQPGTSAIDDPSGVPVTARIALHNLFTCGLCADEVRLIQGLSTDPHIRQQAADRQYAVVVIDGDHSAEGVLADLWWVETICLPGAVVIMDDYGDRRWRGVETAVGAYHADRGLLELVGTASTSAYLRMRQ